MAKEVNLTEELKRNFGFDTFKGNQEAIIRNLLAGNDTFVDAYRRREVALLSIAVVDS